MKPWVLAILLKPFFAFLIFFFVWFCHYLLGKLPDSWFKRLLFRRWLVRWDRWDRLQRSARESAKRTTY